MTILKWIAGIVIASIAAFFFMGYRFHFENLHYYFKYSSSGVEQMIHFKNGVLLRGTVLQETPTTLKINAEGAVSSFSRSEIQSIEAGSPPSFWASLRKNYTAHHEKHPLITRGKGKSIFEKFDHAIMEPSRIADQIKANNPGITGPNPAAYLAQARSMKERVSAANRKAEAEVNAMN